MEIIRVCLNCNKILPENSQRRKYCSNECHQGYLYKTRDRKLQDCKICPQCKTIFVPEARSQKYCGDQCRSDHYNLVKASTAIVKTCPLCKVPYKSRQEHRLICQVLLNQIALKKQQHKVTDNGLTCPGCGKKFIPTHGNQKFCNNKCNIEYYERLNTPTDVKIKKCVQCNMIFKSADPLQFFCSDACHDKHLKIAPSLANKTKICPNCKKSFETSNTKIKFCSLQCQTYFKHKKTVKKGWPGSKYN